MLGGGNAATRAALKDKSEEKSRNDVIAKIRSHSHNKIEEESKVQHHVGGLSARKFSEANQRQVKGSHSHKQKDTPKSPNYQQLKEGTFGPPSSNDAKVSYREHDENKRGHAPKLKKFRESIMKSSKAPSAHGSAKTKKVWQKILREKAKNVGKVSSRNTGRNSRPQLNQTHLDRASASEYSHVASKIRDEVKYHKELSRQYKKMKNHIQEYADQVSEKFSSSSSSVRGYRKEKFTFVGDENNNTHRTNKDTSHHPTGQLESSRLLESAYSPQKPQYYKEARSEYSHGSPNGSISMVQSRRLDGPTHDDLSESKNLTEKGGMLDIANSFLNSPFMLHLSNFGGKSSQMSPTSSINPINTQNNNYPEIGSSGVKLPRGTRRSRNHEESNSRVHDGNQDYSKYSEWTEPYRGEKAGRDNNSILKESGNRRYGADMKEPGIKTCSFKILIFLRKCLYQ